MKQVPLQWHPAFCSSLQIELEGEPLEFRKYPRVYYLTGLPFPTQIIVIKELSKAEHRWLSRFVRSSEFCRWRRRKKMYW